MFFQSYDKIAERLEEYNLSEQAYRTLQKIDWVVCEKIHGANFCVICTPDEILYAKRKEFLAEEDDFFGYRVAMAGKEASFRQLFQDIFTDFPNITTILVYGELFGGAYPHPDIAPLPDAILVQTGVYYSPAIEFCIFDIATVGEEQEATYLPYPAMKKYCHAVALLHSQALYVGKLAEALRYDANFESTLPALLGYPPLPTPNKAEGIVIKPLHNETIQTPKGALRPILKRKIQEFSETQYQQATGQKADNEGLTALKQLAYQMLTPNRLNNAISKVGRVGKKDTHKKQQLSALIETDIQESIAQQYATIWQKTPQKQRLAFWEEVRKGIEKLIIENLA